MSINRQLRLNVVADGAGLAIYRHIVLDYEKELCTAKQRRRQLRGDLLRASENAVATWVHKNIDRGNIKYPCELEATASNLYASNGEVCPQSPPSLFDLMHNLEKRI